MKDLQVGDRVYITGVIDRVDNSDDTYSVRLDPGDDTVWFKQNVVTIDAPAATLKGTDTMLTALQAFKAANQGG